MARVAIVSLGCPKNAIDSEALAGLVASGGHALTPGVEDADVVLVNTCGFIDPARRETVEEVLELAELKQRGSLRGLVLTGCLVARSAADLDGALPEVDAFVDFDAYPGIAHIVDGVLAGTLDERVHGRPGTRFDPAYWDATIAAAPRIRFGRKPWAYLKIAEGCNRGCTFCAIPLMRGKLASRPPEQVIAEARHLVAGGVRELSLVSQDSVMYGRDIGAPGLTDLLRSLERIEGLERVRLMYLHPQGVDDALIDTMLSSPVVADYFDLSLQHVSAPVLRRMGRWGGRERFEALVTRIRDRAPHAAVRATFILGFPGESEDEAAAVADFVADAGLDWVGTFAYSPEDGTRSAELPGRVPEAEVRARVDAVASVAEEAMSRRAAYYVGATQRVLVERYVPGEDVWIGRSEREAPEIDGETRFAGRPGLAVGDVVDVAITAAEGCDLVGTVAVRPDA